MDTQIQKNIAKYMNRTSKKKFTAYDVSNIAYTIKEWLRDLDYLTEEEIGDAIEDLDESDELIRNDKFIILVL